MSVTNSFGALESDDEEDDAGDTSEHAQSADAIDEEEEEEEEEREEVCDRAPPREEVVILRKDQPYIVRCGTESVITHRIRPLGPSASVQLHCTFFGRCYACRHLGHSQKWCALRFCRVCRQYGHAEQVCRRRGLVHSDRLRRFRPSAPSTTQRSYPSYAAAALAKKW